MSHASNMAYETAKREKCNAMVHVKYSSGMLTPRRRLTHTVIDCQ
jgi:hypothetical protein